MGHKTVIIFVFLLLSYSIQQAFSQNYGLRFFGQNTPIQDKRTSLDLNPNGPLCFNDNFDLSFKITFAPNSKDYFGYIVRMIDDQGHNTDLMIYDLENTKSKSFRIIIGEKFSRILFTLDSNHLYNKWNTIKLHFDKSRDQLVVYCNGMVQTEQHAGIKTSTCFKMLFGANGYDKFKTTDVPDMRLMDVRLSEAGKPMYYWPLDEISGNTAKDELQQVKAKVINPSWIRSMHYNWEQVSNFTLNGNASVGFDPKNEKVYVTGINELHSYSVSDRALQTIPYKSGKFTLLQGNQSLYDTISGKLYNLNIDRNKVAAFNFETKQWDTKFGENERITQFWHANKFISDVDHSLYVLGGYGELKYKNLVQKYNFASKQWSVLRVDSNDFGPRYLAALGVNPHTGNTYIIGGYGSLTGMQMLNPRNYYDLVKFDMNDKSFKVMYKFKYPENDFAFANSLIIDPKTNEFYGLIFSNQKFNSSLQLIRGSLNKPDYQLVGDKIPYQFYDIRSFSDLYYCPVSKKLVAVTLYRRSDNQTEIKLYTIGFPPNMLQVRQQAVTIPWLTYVLYGIGALIIFTGLYFIGLKRKRKIAVSGIPAVVPALNDGANHEVVKQDRIENNVNAGHLTEPVLQKSSIYLFGNLQVFDAGTNNISRLFTPLLKELFLLILIYSIRRKTGVSSEKLNEILWFDKSKKDALNNRSVNIAKLKTILEKVGNCKLSKTTGYWKIEIDYSTVHVDYQQYLDIVNTKQVLDKGKIEALFTLIQRGSILLDTDYEWLDEFKTEVTNEIIDRLLLFARSVDMAADPEILIQTTNHIFRFDPVNEDAMQIQCKVLASLGKHSVSKHVYEKFVKEYKSIYNEDYNKSFHSIIE